VELPQDHRWSSVHTHLALARDPLITPHPLCLAMGSHSNERACAYQERLDARIALDDLQHLRLYARRERALGDGACSAWRNHPRAPGRLPAIGEGAARRWRWPSAARILQASSKGAVDHVRTLRNVRSCQHFSRSKGCA
ncbi:MAG: hypothetical protein ABI128_04115, partial [Rhodanobacter sp.]